MSTIDVKAMLEGLRPQLERDRAEGKLDGITIEDLERVATHPKAAEVIAEVMQQEMGSVQQGEPAPDFTLPRLSSKPAGRGETLTLSDHFGKRPVALIFGSYT